ncbi:centrosomal protein of 104 kDa, partial [Oryzias melastigma]|uniref:centrosomal protein of 104 kDa n=1 Tax=Oryzias melastigma TaxID=30732 RepID=UPI000CF7D182
VHHQLLFLWQFSRVALDHSTKEVRELARRIILLLYQQHQGDVLDLLPPHDGAAPKNFLYKRLFDGFSQIDGKLTETQDLEKGGIQLDDEEVRSLQEQLAGLKEMTGGGAESPRHPEGQQQVTKDPPKAAKAVCASSSVKRTSLSPKTDWTCITGNTVRCCIDATNVDRWWRSLDSAVTFWTNVRAGPGSGRVPAAPRLCPPRI